jgi:hypothetical protein
MRNHKYIPILTVIFLLLTACSTEPTAVPVPDTLEPTPELIEAGPTLTPETAKPAAGGGVFDIEETKTTLLVYSGNVRVSHDSGESWTNTYAGLPLETGDRIQVSEGGHALILFPDGSLIRLVGFTDFELVLNEFDIEAGTKGGIGMMMTRIINGAPAQQVWH